METSPLPIQYLDERPTKHSVTKNDKLLQNIDIGIVASCLSDKFQDFINFMDLSDSWNIRFLAIEYECKNKKDEIIFPNTINGFNVKLADNKENEWTRASNINKLQSMIRPNSIFLALDIDIKITDTAISNILKFVKPNVMYFPIVWSMYPPELIESIEKELNKPITPFSNNQGIWREFGYGIFVVHSTNIDQAHMDESFKGWGGEDKELYDRINYDTSTIQIVRSKR